MPIRFSRRVIMYPAGVADLDALNVGPDSGQTNKLSELQSAQSGVNPETINLHATIAFSFEFDWDGLFSCSHAVHLEFVRAISEAADVNCLDLVRYRQCNINQAETLPARAGQIENNHMMAGALLYNPVIECARVLGGAAFTHFITRGLGLPVESSAADTVLQDGEVGHIASHALSLYSTLLESDNETTKFVQALSLLEFLADPHAFQRLSKVKAVVANYVARSASEYYRILDRFIDLTGKTDPVTGAQLGYRTRIVHIGDRLDRLVPPSEDRRKLFEELDGYIRPIIDHMITHSAFDFEAYREVRDRIRPSDLGRASTADS
jgi:hypothetical protein